METIYSRKIAPVAAMIPERSFCVTLIVPSNDLQIRYSFGNPLL
jgi:hypothetical protein